MSGDLQTIQLLLQQQQVFFGERFDRHDERVDRIESLVQSVDISLKLLNGTVARHATAIAELKSPDQKTAPFLTQSEGALLRKAVGLAVSVGTALYFVGRWVAANWSALVPGVVAFGVG